MKSTSGTKATKRIYVGNSVYVTNIDLSYHNGSFGWTIVNKNGQNFVPVRTCSIEKKGSTITFNIAGTKHSYTDPSWENLKVHQVTIAFGQYASQPALFTNGLITQNLLPTIAPPGRISQTSSVQVIQLQPTAVMRISV